MNQKELNELKKNFREECGFMTINRITSVYVNPANEPDSIVYQTTEIPGTMEQDRYDYIMIFLRSILKGKIGKGNKEYVITNESTNNLFKTILDSNLTNDEELNIYINHIINNYDMVSPYALFIAHSTYSVLKSTKNNDALENTDEFSGDSDDYDFMITAICPVDTVNEGLIYNDKFIKDVDIRKSVQAPLSGFIYPTFSNREADNSSVLIYDKSCKKPNKSMVDVCGAEFTLPMPTQKEMFNNMLTSVIGNDLDYTLITDINDAFAEKLFEQNQYTEPATLSKDDVVRTLIEAGVDTKYEEMLNKRYDSTFEDINIDTSAIVDKSTTITTGNFVIKCGSDMASQLTIKEVSGRRCVVIPIENVVEVNDMPITR